MCTNGPPGHTDEVIAPYREKYQLNLLDIWALAYDRHQRNLLVDSQWNAWNNYFS